MVRLSKLNNKQQASWGPHSLSASIDKTNFKDKALPDFPAKSTTATAVLSPGQHKNKNNARLPSLLPSKAERARESPYISHMIRRDREHMLHKLGSIKVVQGNYKYENLLSNMLHDLSPVIGAPNLTLTALTKAGSVGNIRAPRSRGANHRKNKNQSSFDKGCVGSGGGTDSYSLESSAGSSQSSLGGANGNGLTEYPWWRESDQSNFNYNPHNLNPSEDSFYTADSLLVSDTTAGLLSSELGGTVTATAITRAEMDSNSAAMIFDPPAPTQGGHICLVDQEDDDDLISTASDAESGRLEDELLSSRESQNDGEFLCLDTDAEVRPIEVREVIADPNTNPDSAFIVTTNTGSIVADAAVDMSPGGSGGGFKVSFANDEAVV